MSDSTPARLYQVNPARLAELKAMPRCPECKALLKICEGKH